MSDVDLKQLEGSIEPLVERTSRLDPYRDAIFSLRQKGYSFRRIQSALAKNGITVAVMTLYSFVRVREKRRSFIADPEAPILVQPKRVDNLNENRERARSSNITPRAKELEPDPFPYNPETPMSPHKK